MTPPNTTRTALTTSAAPVMHMATKTTQNRYGCCQLQDTLAVSPMAYPQDEMLGWRNRHCHSPPNPSQTVAQQGCELPELHPLPNDGNSNMKDKSKDWPEIIDGLFPSTSVRRHDKRSQRNREAAPFSHWKWTGTKSSLRATSDSLFLCLSDDPSHEEHGPFLIRLWVR